MPVRTGALLALALLAAPAQAAPRAKPAPRPVRVKLGLSAAPAYVFTRQDGRTADATGSLGFELDVHAGRPEFGLMALTGVRRTRVAAGFFGADAEDFLLVPVLAGVSSSPFKLIDGPRLRVRPDLGVAFGLVVPFNSNPAIGLPAGFGAEVKLGLDYYFKGDAPWGLATDVVFPLTTLGSTSASSARDVRMRHPALMVRVSSFFWTVPFAGG